VPSPESALIARLRGSDRRSIGASNAVAAAIRRNPGRVSELVPALFCDDPVLRMRVADALEKVCRHSPSIIQPYRSALLRLASDSDQPEFQWHLAQLLRQLTLTPAQRRRVVVCMQVYLVSSSAIVRTEALTTLAAMARLDPRLGAGARRLIDDRLARGSAAERARARQLLREQTD